NQLKKVPLRLRRACVSRKIWGRRISVLIGSAPTIRLGRVERLQRWVNGNLVEISREGRQGGEVISVIRIISQSQKGAFFMSAVMQDGRDGLWIQRPVGSPKTSAGDETQRAELPAVEETWLDGLKRAVGHLGLPFALLAGPSSIQVDHGSQPLAVFCIEAAGYHLHVFDAFGGHKTAEQATHRLG